MTAVPSIRLIAEAAAEHAGISYSELVSEGRTAPLVRARTIAAGLARKLARRATTTIGRHLGRDHTTIITALRRYDDGIAHDPAFARDASEVEEAVLAASGTLKRLSIDAPDEAVAAHVPADLADLVAAAGDAADRLLGAGGELNRAAARIAQYARTVAASEAKALLEAEADAGRLRDAAKAMIAALAVLDAATVHQRHADIDNAQKLVAAARADLCRAISPPVPDEEENRQ